MLNNTADAVELEASVPDDAAAMATAANDFVKESLVAGTEKPKLELTRVSGPPPVPLKVNMARQVSEYFTGTHWPEISDLDKPFNYVLQPDGLWEIRNVQAGWLVRRREKFTKPLPGFVEEKREDYGVPRYGKIPAALYWQIVSFFKEICNDSGDEVYVQTFWNPATNAYENHVPKQIVSGASVRYERDQDLEARCPLVVETHSHNNMSAFFSGVDNADEKSDRFFGVLGKLGSHSPEVLYSFLCGGVRTNIPVSDIFDMGYPDTFPLGWKEQVTRQSMVVGLQRGSQGMGGTSYPYQVQQDRTRAWERGGASAPSWEGGQTRQWQGGKTKTKEAKEEVERATQRAEAALAKELQGDDFLSQDEDEELGGLTHRPFFRLSSRGSSIGNEELVDTMGDLLVDFSDPERKASMTDEEKTQLFLNLIGVMDDDDICLLASTMVDVGYGEHMLQALDEAEAEGFEDEDLDDSEGSTAVKASSEEDEAIFN